MPEEEEEPDAPQAWAARGPRASTVGGVPPTPSAGHAAAAGGGAAHELYRALRGAAADDPLEDELLLEGDYITSQREFLQQKEKEELLERLARRIGRNHAAV